MFLLVFLFKKLVFFPFFRYFYLQFDDLVSARIIDVGVQVRHGEGTYLGALHIHEGIKNTSGQPNGVKIVSKNGKNSILCFGLLYVNYDLQ